MARQTTKFICQQCAYESVQWMGRCPNCDTWNSLIETRIATESIKEKRISGETKIVKLSQIKGSSARRLTTGLNEFDRVLGGGLVPGSVILLAGDPGIGKSTLLLQVAGSIAGGVRVAKVPSKQKPDVLVLYVSGEESPEQIKLRAERLGIKSENLFFANETNVEAVIEMLESQISQTALIIIDSIQTMWTEALNGTAGSVGQVRESAAKLLQFAKTYSIPMFLVGHVTKEGGIAGPMVLSHLVDSVLFFEGEKYQTLRVLRSIKNRFGPTDEIGVFSMEERGLVEVDNPSALFLAERKDRIPGSVVTCLMEGSRPLLVEVQALVVSTQLPVPRRVAAGVDWNRLQLLVAVLSRRAGLPLASFDVFVNVAGGIKITEPGADLAIALAIVSAWADKPIDQKVCAVGEVGLLGEIRIIGQLEKRIKEAQRLGFNKIISPRAIPTVKEAIKLVLK